MAGGKRPGAGRPKGAKNKRTIALEEAARRAAAGEPEGITSLGLFQRVYKNKKNRLDLRMAAAEKCLPYEHPRLSNVEVSGKDGGAISAKLVVEQHIVDHRPREK